LLVDGRPVRFRSPQQARNRGIATVWQDLAIAPLMSVWRNFVLGAEPTRGVWPVRRLDVGRAEEIAAREMTRVGVPGLDPGQPASALQAGERQSLAIAQARCSPWWPPGTPGWPCVRDLQPPVRVAGG
jgi:simple sugar transport system ATP-binding protein